MTKKRSMSSPSTLRIENLEFGTRSLGRSRTSFAKSATIGLQKVEIKNPSYTISRVSHPLAVDEDMLANLKKLEHILVGELMSLKGLEWSSLTFHSRSPKDDWSSHVPTVLLFCKLGSWFDYGTLESKIQNLIDTFKPGIGIEILPGMLISSSLTEPRALRPVSFQISDVPTSGSSIGIHGDVRQAGLFGWYGWAKLPGEKIAQAVGCTGFHVVVSNDRDVQELTMAESVRLTQADGFGLVKVDFPAAMNRVAEAARLSIALLSDPANQAIIQDLQSPRRRSELPILGEILGASGLRKNKDSRRMDWSLFTVGSVQPNRCAPS